MIKDLLEFNREKIRCNGIIKSYVDSNEHILRTKASKCSFTIEVQFLQGPKFVSTGAVKKHLRAEVRILFFALPTILQINKKILQFLMAVSIKYSMIMHYFHVWLLSSIIFLPRNVSDSIKLRRP